jgi:hypothetical protein
MAENGHLPRRVAGTVGLRADIGNSVALRSF